MCCNGIPHLRKCILRKRGTENFHSIKNFTFFCTVSYLQKFKKVTVLKLKRSHCIKEWFRLIFRRWFLNCRILLYCATLSRMEIVSSFIHYQRAISKCVRQFSGKEILTRAKNNKTIMSPAYQL